MKQKAVIRECTHKDDIEHKMLDCCYNCAPFWRVYPICPNCENIKLNLSGYCRKCKKYYDIMEVRE